MASTFLEYSKSYIMEFKSGNSPDSDNLNMRLKPSFLKGEIICMYCNDFGRLLFDFGNDGT